MDYHLLRGLADSWFLVAMVVFFLGAVGWAFRPGSRRSHEEAGRMPLQYEDRPAPAPSAAAPAPAPASPDTPASPAASPAARRGSK